MSNTKEVAMKDFVNTYLMIPHVSKSGAASKFKPINKDDSLINILEKEMPSDDVIKFEKKRPRWSEDRGSYVLNFGKRIKEASVKNTQFIKSGKIDNSEEEVYFQVSIRLCYFIF